MADFGVIGDVSSILETTLTRAFATLQPGPPVAMVHDLSGTVPTTPPTLTITLYEVVEDGSARNRPPTVQTTPTGPGLRKPPMALLLRYLLTPWGGDPITEQRMAGRALQVLYQDAILGGPRLQGDLQGSADALKVTLAPLSLEERARVWYAIQKPYRLSLNYEVRVVKLDVARIVPAGFVQSRTLDWAMPEGRP
jgi:Pvc16 N-terminal domain